MALLQVFTFTSLSPSLRSSPSWKPENSKLESEIQTLTIKVKHLDELVAANKQLEIELAKKKERLPPEEEAIMLPNRSRSRRAVRAGYQDESAGAPTEDASKLFIKMPVNVEVAGVYHTAALFFDRINRLPRIITVSGLKIGSPKVDQGRIVSQTTFDLVAYAAPQEKAASGAPSPATAPNAAQAGK